MTQTALWSMSDSQYARSPVVCMDFHSRCWVAWISCGPNGESVRASFYNASSKEHWSPPRMLSPVCRAVTGPAVAPYRDGIVAVWVEDGPLGGLKVAAVDCDCIKEPMLLAPGKAAPAHPTAAANSTGFCVFWTVRDRSSRRVEGVVSSCLSEDMEIRHISEKGRKAAYPKAAMKDGAVAVVWQEMTKDFSSVSFCKMTPSSPVPSIRTLVEDAEACAAMPNAAASANGFWTVWQTDRDVDTGPELVRGIEVLHIADDGALYRPASLMPKIERRGQKEDQGLEFPIPLCAPDGRLTILARGSQSLRRLDLGANGWSDIVQTDDPGWQCRGRPSTAVLSSDGIFLASREKGAAVIRKLPLDIGVSGPPALQAAADVPKVYLKASAEKPRNLIFGGFRVLFGDIHQHTAGSDGAGTPEETYFRARARYGDRVVAVTDHESFLGKQTFEGEWRDACRIADEYYEPGSFVTLKGFEWTGKMHPGPGHKVVYTPAAGGPMLSRDNPQTQSSAGLIKKCRAMGALVFPHHVGWTGADMEHHAADVQTCWEIVSCHGAYERKDDVNIGTRGDDKEGQFIADALDRNLRFGFVGGSDGHGLSFHHGVSRKQDSHRTGITGFLSHDLTRDSVLESLRKRRCFATSGAKIALWFEVDGRPMGEELITGYEVPFRVIAVSPKPICSLCLVTNGGLEISISFGETTADIHGTLPPPPNNEFSYYFVRLRQEDGEIAWSSPIWLDPPAPA